LSKAAGEAALRQRQAGGDDFRLPSVAEVEKVLAPFTGKHWASNAAALELKNVSPEDFCEALQSNKKLQNMYQQAVNTQAVIEGNYNGAHPLVHFHNAMIATPDMASALQKMMTFEQLSQYISTKTNGAVTLECDLQLLFNDGTYFLFGVLNPCFCTRSK
jgi:hypothetical protein